MTGIAEVPNIPLLNFIGFIPITMMLIVVSMFIKLLQTPSDSSEQQKLAKHYRFWFSLRVTLVVIAAVCSHKLSTPIYPIPHDIYAYIATIILFVSSCLVYVLTFFISRRQRAKY